MFCKRVPVALAVLSLPLAAACGDDAPSTNTVAPPSVTTVGDGSVSPTEPTEGNVGDITGSTPVAAADDSVIQGDQPMQSSAVD